jgi:kumamolisin
MKIGKGLKIAVTGLLLGSVGLGASATGLTQVRGNVAPTVAKAKMTGHHNPRAKLNISVALKLNNGVQLDTFLHSLHDRSSPNYRKFLTQAQFAAAYGPTTDQVQGVVGFLTSHGIDVTSVSKSGTRIHATATTATLESAFGVAINDYKLNGTTFYAASGNPNLPANVAASVVAVLGLDNAVSLVAHNVQNLHPAPAPKGRGAGPSGFSPLQIATAYDWPDISAANSNAASGVTIAVATAFTYRPQDIQKFWSTFGLPTHTLTNVSIDGTTNVLNGETTLDIERSSSMSPGSAILVYEASTPAFVSFDDEFARIADDNDADVVTTSWGSAESGGTPAPASVIAEHGSFQQMTSEGMVIMAAAGDDGSADRATGTDNADFPSSDPYVIAAGGTSLSLNPDNSIGQESAWSGAGGADSKFFAEPDYQISSTQSTFVGNAACDGDHTGDFLDDTSDTPNEAGDGCTAAGADSRQSSDMSMDANPGTGYAIYFNGRWEVFGGTSFVAPELAGLFANLTNQAGGRVGSGPVLIYCVANDGNYSVTFHDITSGSNGKFSADTGWDHPTGWGTPDASEFITDALNNCF